MNIIELLKQDEGFSAKVYLCPAGHKTIGYGQRIEGGGEVTAAEVAAAMRDGTITKLRAAELLHLSVSRIDRRLGYLSDSELSINWWGLDEVRQAVLISMAYNMGLARLLKFRDMLDALGRQDFNIAAREMMTSGVDPTKPSKWAEEMHSERPGLQRAERLATMMRTGEWPQEGAKES